jgi:hypothetical protein
MRLSSGHDDLDEGDPIPEGGEEGKIDGEVGALDRRPDGLPGPLVDPIRLVEDKNPTRLRRRIPEKALIRPHQGQYRIDADVIFDIDPGEVAETIRTVHGGSVEGRSEAIEADEAYHYVGSLRNGRFMGGGSLDGKAPRAVGLDEEEIAKALELPEAGEMGTMDLALLGEKLCGEHEDARGREDRQRRIRGPHPRLLSEAGEKDEVIEVPIPLESGITHRRAGGDENPKA